MLILVIEAKCYSLRGVSSEPTTTGRSLLPRKWRCRTMADQTGPRHSTLWSRGWARALTPERRPVSHPRSSNRTCGLPASGFPTGFTADSRTRLHLNTAELQYSQLAEHRFNAEAVGSAGLHLVTPPQEMPYALVNVVVNRPIRRFPGPVAEVCRPAPQNLIQPVPHLLPGPRVVGY